MTELLNNTPRFYNLDFDTGPQMTESEGCFRITCEDF